MLLLCMPTLEGPVCHSVLSIKQLRAQLLFLLLFSHFYFNRALFHQSYAHTCAHGFSWPEMKWTADLWKLPPLSPPLFRPPPPPAFLQSLYQALPHVRMFELEHEKQG